MFAAVKSKLITIKLKPTYLNGHNFEIKLKCATFIRCEERQEGIWASHGHSHQTHCPQTCPEGGPVSAH